jgi:ABC-type transport system substrate-binding protein
MKEIKKSLEMLAIYVIIAMLLTSPVYATVNLDNYPRLDTQYTISSTSEADMITKAQAGTIDTAYDIRSKANVATLQGINWYISTNLGYGFHYWGMNNRAVTPAESGSVRSYHGRTPGVPLFPLNMSQFRYAMHLLIGGSVTDNALSITFGWTQVRIEAIPSPAAGFWYDASLPPFPYDPAQALSVLASIGISNTTAGHVGVWWCSDDTLGPTGELRHIYVLGSTEAISSTTKMSIFYTAAWNAFFGNATDGKNYFAPDGLDIMPFNDCLDIYSTQRDPDVWGGGWGVGRDPDYLYAFYNSAHDLPDGENSQGTNDPYIDLLTYAIHYWRWPNGTYINSVAEMIPIAYALEEYTYYSTPFIAAYCAVAVNAFAPGLKSWIESLGYGSDIGASYNWIYWGNDLTKTSIDQSDSSHPKILNPITSTTVYDWEILNRIYDGLYDIEPFLHKDVNWAMSGYTLKPWIDTSIGVQYGTEVDVTLRPDIYWQSGHQVTAADIAWAYDFVQNLSMPRYADIVDTYYNTTYDTTLSDLYHFKIFMNCTGIWTVYTYLGSALLFPKAVYQTFWNDYVNAGAFTPWTHTYDDWTGETGHGALTCLIGTGPWILQSFDFPTGAATLVANRPGAMYAANPGYWAGLGFGGPSTGFVREDLNFDGLVDLFDAVLLAGAAGATPGNPRWNYGQADITADYIIDLFDAVKLAGHAGWVTLPT